MTYPLRRSSGDRRLVACAALSVVALAIHRRQSVRAKTPQAPHGMLSFALAGDIAKAERIRVSWPRRTRRKADRNLLLDPAFSLVWTNAIALADLWAADVLAARRWPGATLGNAVAWAQWPAALLAAAKDVALLAVLRERRRRPLAPLARWAAVIAIGIKGLGIACAAAAALTWSADRCLPCASWCPPPSRSRLNGGST